MEPDEEAGDQSVFDGLVHFIDTSLDDEERKTLFCSQLPVIIDLALELKTLKPPRGLHFSLQQQSKCHLAISNHQPMVIINSFFVFFLIFENN